MEYPDGHTRDQWLAVGEANRNPFFVYPENRNQHIWRYMDFAKFVALIDSRSLYFPSAENLNDSFEGSVSIENLRLRPLHIDEIAMQFPAETRDSMRRTLLNNAEVASHHLAWQRCWTYISCWHVNDQESAAMWQLYAESKQAIAIQSTFERLRKCLVRHKFPPMGDPILGKVNYVDYAADVVRRNVYLSEYFYKRKSFMHEEEVRAVMQELPLIPVAWDDNGNTTASKFDMEKKPLPGKSLDIDLDQLVEAIYVAPGAPTWLTPLVERIVNKYNLKKKVHNSALDGTPVY